MSLEVHITLFKMHLILIILDYNKSILAGAVGANELMSG